MDDQIEQLPNIDLSGYKIWLSGSVPESEQPKPDTTKSVEYWQGSELEQGILGFVEEFSSLVFKYGGTLIHGSHPTLTPILLEQAQKFVERESDERVLRLVVSNYFSNASSEKAWGRWKRYAQVSVVEKTGDAPEDRERSLVRLRELMASECNAFVVIGGLWWAGEPGKASIPKEFELATTKDVPCFVLGGFGGASKTYITDKPGWSKNLRNGLTESENSDLASTNDLSLAAGKIAAQLQLLKL
jgi:hypothetical protein